MEFIFIKSTLLLLLLAERETSILDNDIVMILYVWRMVFNEFIFLRSLVLPYCLTVSSSPFLCSPPLTRRFCITRVKNRYSPQCSLGLTLFSWGKWKAHILCWLEGQRKKITITFMIQWQIIFCPCQKGSMRRNKGPKKIKFTNV